MKTLSSCHVPRVYIIHILQAQYYIKQQEVGQVYGDIQLIHQTFPNHSVYSERYYYYNDKHLPRINEIQSRI